ncbi:MAG: SusD/RagB family nutrient-binding outer membrane lipoprotein [Dysgonamonadaceae bacterium]|mgnify:FL=1|nr:SusD/RagB family nutrient-binding outer membrane lipoprotein [Dysgonamonadaceae bacterium]
MKSKLLIIFSATIMFFTAVSCSDWLDVNHDPNALEQIPDAKVLLPAAEIGIANNLMGWDFGFAGAFWVEYWTQSYTASQFKTLTEYLPQEFNTTYQSLMREPLTDLKRIKTMTAEDENKGYYFIAEALSIFTWQIITDVWGDMPYTEALRADEGILHPIQDKGQDIYADLMTRVNALLAIDLSESSIDSKFDYIYEGDLDEWYRFASSLKLKLMLRLSETPQYDNAAVLSYIQGADLLTTSAKIPGSVWDDEMEGKRHPMREFEAGGANYFSTNVIASKNFIDYLNINSDPRLAKLFTGTKGAFYGDFDSKEDSDSNGTTDDKETYARALFKGDMDLMLMSDWEVNFYIAEVYARAQNSQAEVFYERGVTASLNQHGISDTEIIETGYAAWNSGTIEQNIKQIAMQKWVANANYQHIESFLERNRTKYPAVNEINIEANRKTAFENFPVGDLTISVKGRALLNGNLPASPLYPSSYIFRNTNAPDQKANIGQKVWWNVKTGK